MGVSCVHLHDWRFFLHSWCNIDYKHRHFALGLFVILAMSGLQNNLKGFAYLGAASVNITATSLTSLRSLTGNASWYRRHVKLNA